MPDIPGLKVSHQIITPTCRDNRTIAGALDEAVERVSRLYLKYAPDPANDHVNWHLVLIREEPSDA